jgi:hypothetical protein
MVGPERTLAMKLGFALPIVGPAVSGAAGLSAFCRGLEDLGYDTLWVGDRLVTPVDMHSTYPGEEQPYPPQMTRYLDPVLLWTVAAAAPGRHAGRPGGRARSPCGDGSGARAAGWAGRRAVKPVTSTEWPACIFVLGKGV